MSVASPAMKAAPVACKMLIYRTKNSFIKKSTTRLRRFASCRNDESIYLKGSFPNLTEVELLTWVEDQEGSKFGHIRVPETGQVGYVKADYIHTVDKALKLAVQSKKKPRKSMDKKSTIVQWEVVQQTMVDTFARVREAVYKDLKELLVEKYGRPTVKKHKQKIKQMVASFGKQLKKGENGASVLPPPAPMTPAVTETSDDDTPRSPLNVHTSRRMSVSTRASKKLDSILRTPSGMLILQQEAAKNGLNVEACRQMLHTMVRKAAKEAKLNRKPRMSLDVAHGVAAAPSPIKSRSSLDTVTEDIPGHRRRRSNSTPAKLVAEEKSANPSGTPVAERRHTEGCRSKATIIDQRLIDKVIRKFNLNYKSGLQELMQSKVVGSKAQQLGDFLRETKGLNKEHVGEVLGRPEEVYLAILEAYVAGFNFSGIEYIVALRQFFESFKLPGEAQKISRILSVFAKYYTRANPTNPLNSEDTVFVVCYAILMLNTSLHSQKLKTSDRMTKQDFEKILKGCDDGKDLPLETVHGIYDNIKAKGLLHKQADRHDVSGNLFTNLKLAGPMEKKSESTLLYQKRWMLLTQENQLFYFKNEDSVNPLGFILLSSARMKVKPGKECIKLLPLEGERQVKSVKIFEDKKKGSILGEHDYIYLKVPKPDKDSTHPDFNDWVAAFATICRSDSETCVRDISTIRSD